ncbi:MAG: hypothetical protein ACYSOW_04180 [Planctomycetota bacterium]
MRKDDQVMIVSAVNCGGWHGQALLGRDAIYTPQSIPIHTRILLDASCQGLDTA